MAERTWKRSSGKLARTIQKSIRFVLRIIMYIISKLPKALVLGVLTLALVSCGGSQPMVDNVSISTDQIDGDIYVGLDADLSIGNLSLPNASFPIILPKSGKEIGQLSLMTTLEGKNQLSVDVNVSETANLDLSSVALPNGSKVPLIGDRPVIAVPIGKGAQVYISLTQDSAAIGLSVPISSFDALGAKVGKTSLMPVFNTNGIVGAAGIFTSSSPGQNGFALVADVSGALGNLVKSNVLEDHSSRMVEKQMASDELDFNLEAPTRSQKKVIDRELYRMHRRDQQLEL